MNNEMTTNSQLSTTELKQNQKQTKQTTRKEQNHRNEDHMEVISGEREEGEWGKRSIVGRYKIDRRRLRIV